MVFGLESSKYIWCGKKYSFWLQKELNLKTNIIFEIFECQFFGNVMISYHMKSVLKDPAQETMKTHFSLVFYEKI